MKYSFFIHNCPQETNPYASLVFYWEPLNRQVSVFHIPVTYSFTDKSADF